MTKSLKAKTKQQLKKTTLIWQDLVTMSIQLESREMFEVSDETIPKPKI